MDSARPNAVQSLDEGIEDPKEKPVEKVREIRDEIEKRVKSLISETD